MSSKLGRKHIKNTGAVEKSKPVFNHPKCSHCTFVGSYKQHDLYVCWGDKEKTVIARYGDDGPAYTSGISLAPHNEVLAETLRRGIDRGLIPEVIKYPVVMREAFRDNLEAIEEFSAATAKVFEGFIGRAANPSEAGKVRVLLKGVWSQFYVDKKVFAKEMPMFYFTLVRGVMEFEWRDYTVSPESYKYPHRSGYSGRMYD